MSSRSSATSSSPADVGLQHRRPLTGRQEQRRPFPAPAQRHCLPDEGHLGKTQFLLELDTGPADDASVLAPEKSVTVGAEMGGGKRLPPNAGALREAPPDPVHRPGLLRGSARSRAAPLRIDGGVGVGWPSLVPRLQVTWPCPSRAWSR